MQVMYHMCSKDTVLSKHKYIKPVLVQITQHANYNKTFHVFVEPTSPMISSNINLICFTPFYGHQSDGH